MIHPLPWCLYTLIVLVVPKTAISVVPTSLLLSVPLLCCCHRLHFHVSPSPMHLLSCVSTASIFRHPYPPTTFSTIPILFFITAASVVIFPCLCCGPHNIIFHPPASFNAIICIHVSCISAMSSAGSIFNRSQISTIYVLISNPTYPLPLLFFSSLTPPLLTPFHRSRVFLLPLPFIICFHSLDPLMSPRLHVPPKCN